MIEVKLGDLHPGSGTLAELFNKPGVALSVRNLMELMLLISDNSATDILLREAGGPEAVTARMRSLGIDGINVNRSCARLIADWVGVTNLPPEENWSPEMFKLVFSTVNAEDQKAAAKKFEQDPRDTSTPDGMAGLLERVYRKDLLKSESAELLLDIMRRCRTGQARLRGILPEGTEIAHKTGTIGGTTNDSRHSHVAGWGRACSHRRVREVFGKRCSGSGAHHRRNSSRGPRFFSFSATTIVLNIDGRANPFLCRRRR